MKLFNLPALTLDEYIQIESALGERYERQRLSNNPIDICLAAETKALISKFASHNKYETVSPVDNLPEKQRASIIEAIRSIENKKGKEYAPTCSETENEMNKLLIKSF